jgi:hypothetical protein
MKNQSKITKELSEYKNRVVFLRKSKAGKHLFVFDSRKDLEAGASLIMDISEVERLVAGTTDWIKVSVLPEADAGSTDHNGSGV